MLINNEESALAATPAAVACQRQNDLLPTQHFIRYEEQETGTYPNVGVETVPLQCMHCEDAPCVAVCPTGAAFIGADGVVGVDHGRCIGCKYCMAVMPLPGAFVQRGNGTVDKCRFCTVSAEGDGHEDVLVRGGLLDGRPHIRRLGRSRVRDIQGHCRGGRSAYLRRLDQSQSILREVMNDDV